MFYSSDLLTQLRAVYHSEILQTYCPTCSAVAGQDCQASSATKTFIHRVRLHKGRVIEWDKSR